MRRTYPFQRELRLGRLAPMSYRLTALVLMGVVALVALGATTAALTAGPTEPQVTSASTQTCATQHLSVRFVRAGVATGTAMQEFSFVNTGAPCHMRGFPTVQMLTAEGTALSTTQHDTRITGVPRTGMPTVRIAHGSRAYFWIMYLDGTGFTGVSCPRSAALRLTPPGSRGSVVLKGSYAEIAPYGGHTIQAVHCGDIRVSALSPENAVN